MCVCVYVSMYACAYAYVCMANVMPKTKSIPFGWFAFFPFTFAFILFIYNQEEFWLPFFFLHEHTLFIPFPHPPPFSCLSIVPSLSPTMWGSPSTTCRQRESHISVVSRDSLSFPFHAQLPTYLKLSLIPRTFLALTPTPIVLQKPLIHLVPFWSYPTHTNARSSSIQFPCYV